MFYDLKYALSSLLKTPSFTAIAVLTLALGIGASTAIFSIVNSVLLRPLPYAQPEQLMRIYTKVPIIKGLDNLGVSKPEYLEIRRDARSWDAVEAVMSGGANMATGSTSDRVAASFVTGGMLDALGVAPAFGRLITRQDDELGAARVVVISHGLWQRAFGSDRAVIGRDILLEGIKHTVVGVMPQNFLFPPGASAPSDIWAPLQIDPANPGERSAHLLSVMGRLKSGVTPQQAQAEFDALVKEWAKGSDPDRFMPGFHTLALKSLHEEVVGGARPALRMLFGAVCFLALMACVNVANLLLARAEDRQRDTAIRGALGAGIGQLARQFMTEGVLLALAGAVLGMALAQGGLQLIKATAAADIPRAAEIAIDGRVALFALLMSLLTGILSALAPLTHVARRNLHDAMKSGAVSTTDSVSTRRFRQILIVAQLALALVLLTGTGLMLKAFWKLQNVNGGFDPRSIITMSVSLPRATYPGAAARDFWARLEARLKALPGVQNVGFTTSLPPAEHPSHMTTWVEGFVPTKEMPVPTADFYQLISNQYFETLRIPPVQGRFFDERDDARAPPVAIVNQTMARMYWKDANPVGRRVRPYLSDWYTVVGVVADVKNAGLDKPTGTAMYLPYTQAASHNVFIQDFFLPYMSIAIRASGDPAPIVDAVRREVRAIDPTVPLAAVQTMDEVVSKAQSRPRFLTLTLTVFAGIALALAAVGIYGVIAYAVSRRTREFGLRMALGAQPASVLNLVLRGGLVLAVFGVVLGVIGSFATTRFLSGFLFEVTPTDPQTFIGVSVLLTAIAVLASYFPARRATKVDPLAALRTE